MAETTQKNLYDGLFLISPHEMGGDLSAALEHIQGMLDRAGAETLALRKWDERRMAYRINGQTRGVYLLAIFRVDPAQIANIQRDCNLSEMVMRELLLSADHLGEVEIDQEANRAQATQDEAALTDESSGDSTAQGSESPSEAESMAQSDAGPIPDQGPTEGEAEPQPAGQSV